MRMRLPASAWFTLAVSLVALVIEATVAVNVSQGVYPMWAAWPGFLVGLIPLLGVGSLASDWVRAQREAWEDTRIHRIS